MKNRIKKTLCLILSIVLIFSTLSVAVSAFDFTFSPNYFFSKTNNQNATDLLNKADKILREEVGFKEKIVLVQKNLFTNEIAITVDLTSVNGVCKTIDLAKSVLGGASGALVKPVIGDLGSLNFNSWQTGMSRGEEDYTIINEIVELAASNADIIGKFIDGSLNIGVIRTVVKLEDYIDENGVSGIIKKAIVGTVYDEKTEKTEFNKAYKKALINFDTFIYEDILRPEIQDILPGFSMDSSSSFDTVAENAFKIIWKTYIAPFLINLDITPEKADTPLLKKLSNVLNLNGKTISTTLPFDSNKTFAEQINYIFGYIVKQIAPYYSSWIDGDFEMLGRNITSFCYYLANVVGINTLNQKEAVVAYDLIETLLPVLKDGELAEYLEGIEFCMNITEVQIKLLQNIAKLNNITITKIANVNKILGDLLTSFLSQFVNFGYTAGAGVDVWTVLNDFLNKLLYDYDFSSALGLKSTRYDSVFVKLDEIIAMTNIFGNITPDKYKTATLLPRLLDAVLKCDLNSAYEMTAINLVKDFGNDSVAGTIYSAVASALKTRFSATVLVPFSTAKPINNALSNQSLKTMVKNFLPRLNSEKAKILPAALKLIVLLSNEKKIENVKIADQLYTGKPSEPSATVRFNNSILSEGKDYTITYKNNSKPGKGTATITGKGNYYGTTEADFNIKMMSVSSISAVSTSEGIKVDWLPVPGADSYQVYLGNRLAATSYGKSALIEDYEGSTEYTVKVRAVNNIVGPTDFKTTKVVTVPGKVKNFAVRSGFSGLILTWDESKGASFYEIDQLSGSTWKRLASVSEPGYTFKTVKIGESYTFRVRASGSTTLSKGAYSETASAIFNPTIGTVEKVTVTTASSMVTLFWQGVDGADRYEIFVDNISRPSVSGTSSVITGLEPAKEYNIKIRAVNDTYGTSKFTEVTAKTVPENVGTLKYEKTSSTATISWNKSRGAEKYQIFVDDVLKGTTTSTSYKLSKLSSGKSYAVSVRAVNGNFGVSSSSIVLITFPPAKVKDLKATSKGGKITLKWSKADGASSYEIQMKNGSGWKKITTIDALTYTISDLELGKKYTFRVRANSSAGYGDYSSTITAISGIGKVSTLLATTITSKSVKLTWDKISGAEGYVIEQKVGSKWKVFKKLTSNKITISSLSPNTEYKFRVKAYIGKEYGGYSQVLTIRTSVAAPKNFKAKTIEANKVSLTWDKVNGANGYTVYQYKSGAWRKVASTTKTSLSVSKLSPKTSYKFRICAFDSGKVPGNYSSVLTIKTK